MSFFLLFPFQVPWYLLKDYIDRGLGYLCNIICTEPRKVSSIGLTDRVARERGEMTGDIVRYFCAKLTYIPSLFLVYAQASLQFILKCGTDFIHGIYL